MIKLFYTHFKSPLPASLFDTYLSYLPDQLKAKNACYKRWQDRMAHLLGKMLLLKALRSYKYPANALNNLVYDDNKRPGINDKIDFNISHSGSYVICAIAEGIHLGIDIEAINPVDFGDFTITMTEKEWLEIEGAENPIKSFFRYWTIKESVIKADGRGLGIPLRDIRIENNRAQVGEKKWYLKECSIDPEYSCFLAADMPLETAPLVFNYCRMHELV